MMKFYKENDARVVPGDLLAEITKPNIQDDDVSSPQDSTRIGKGTYVRQNRIYASLVGKLSIHVDPNDHHTVLAVVPSSTNAPLSRAVPQTGQVVLAVVQRVTVPHAWVQIVAWPDHNPLSNNNMQRFDSHEGIIRAEDVLSSTTTDPRTQASAVSFLSILRDSFVPGDIVLCRVLDRGDLRRYSLTTAEASLGVLYATSTSGNPLVPVSWNEMECTQTGKRERRKCAKPKVLAR